MAVTIGRFHTPAERHSLTAVSGEFEMSLDLRGYDAGHLTRLEVRLGEIVAAVAARRGVSIALGSRSTAAPGLMDAGLIAAMEQAARGLGLTAPRLNSPGSHDANNFAASGVATGMVLVRNRNGSHNPHEAMDTADLMAAVDSLAVMLGDGGSAGG
jgi:N-carbamoyl-L-amino-acid hydrolase